MGNLNNTTNKFKDSGRVNVFNAKYNRQAGSQVSRIFFITGSFSLSKGAILLKKIYEANPDTKLLFSGGGFYQTHIPTTLCKKDYLKSGDDLENIKIFINGHLSKISKFIKKTKIRVPVFLGIDFLDIVNDTKPVQLAVLFNQGEIHYFSKRYPFAGEIIIEPWSSLKNEIVHLESLGLVLPLVCNDGVLWGGRSVKGLSKKSKRSDLSKSLKKKFKEYSPDLVLDFIHSINSPSSGKIFSSSLKEYNKNSKSCCLGAFGSQKKKFLKELASSSKVPMKIKNLSGNSLENGLVMDFYIF